MSEDAPPTMAEDAASQQEKSSKKEEDPGLWRGTIRPILVVVAIVFVVRAMVIDWNDVPSGSMRPAIQEGDRIAVNRLAYGLNLPVPFLRTRQDNTSFLDLPFVGAHVNVPIPNQPIQWGDPERGDIVIVWHPDPQQAGIRLVKRIVAVPGDTVIVDDGRLTINGEAAEYEELDFLPTGATRDEPTPVYTYRESILDAERVIQIDETERFPPGHPLRVRQTIVLDDDQYLLVGDNRDYSNDGRVFGFAHRNQIVGEAFAIAVSFDSAKNTTTNRLARLVYALTHPRFDRWFKGL